MHNKMCIVFHYHLLQLILKRAGTSVECHSYSLCNFGLIE